MEWGGEGKRGGSEELVHIHDLLSLVVTGGLDLIYEARTKAGVEKPQAKLQYYTIRAWANAQSCCSIRSNGVKQRETDRETERGRDRRTGRQRQGDRERERQTGSQTDNQTGRQAETER